MRHLSGFQSTLLQEERPDPVLLASLIVLNFNPRSYKRSDLGFNKSSCASGKFQSTLLQEERPNGVHISLSRKKFQSTLLQEERLLFAPSINRLNYFNPRSYKRSDHAIFQSPVKTPLNFNPRSYKRSDGMITVPSHANSGFQSTLLQEERQ